MSDSVPSERFAELMISGKYSDLVLECQGKQFKVHRAIVCGHSPVLAAACDSDFKVRYIYICLARKRERERGRSRIRLTINFANLSTCRRRSPILSK